MRLLVVDDNAACRESLARLLRLMGHEVWTLDGGESVCELAVDIRPQLILLDLGMPDLDGYAVLRQLRRDPRTRGVLTVALTGHASEAEVRKALDAGFDRHIAKPAGIAALEEVFAGFAPL